MTTNLTIRQATPQDTPVIHGLIRGLAEYEKRPQDMTATVEQLRHWLFERMAAGAWLFEPFELGYYPAFGFFIFAARNLAYRAVSRYDKTYCRMFADDLLCDYLRRHIER